MSFYFTTPTTSKLKKHIFSGFTLPELIIVLAIFSLLLTFAGVNLFRSQQQATLQSEVSTLVSDIRSQQFNAMSVDVGSGSSPVSYSIYFSENEYVLFQGTTYIPGDSSNFTVEIGESSLFENITFPNQTLSFLPVSGEVRDYTSLTNEITIRNIANDEVKKLIVNEYGVVKEVSAL